MTKRDEISQFQIAKFRIAIARDCFPKQFQELKLSKEREHWIFKTDVNLKEIISFIPHLKGVQFFSISQNIDNFTNVEGPWTLSRPCRFEAYIDPNPGVP